MRRLLIHRAIGDISFDQEEFHRMMGFGTVLPSPFDEISLKISESLRVGIACSEIVIFDSDEVKIEQDKVVIQEVPFFTGRNVNSFLQHCSEAALFICTLGAEFEQRMKLFQGDSIALWFADVMGSLLCEAWADIVHDCVIQEAKKEGFTVTNRYSPGYCNWCVDEQQKLFSFFGKSPTGVTLNDSSLMSPLKSISGIVGMGKDVKQIPYLCNMCADAHCSYRSINNQSI
ncbi:MAG: hypothetical protein FWD56_07560 [Bacteroidales bacterium]|nr:hypothetical protein [Bacteroidales bacterium]